VPGEMWRRLLAEACGAVRDGTPETAPADAAFEVDGDWDHLSSPFPVQDMAVACIGAALAAAVSLRQQRASDRPGGDRPGGDRPGVRLAAGHAAAAVRSEALMRRGGQPAGRGFAPLSRFWPAADGWVRTHANYPWHRDALLTATGAAGDAPEAVGAAIARLPACELEEEVIAAGGVAAAVRTASQWRRHPQGQAVAGRPLIGDSGAGETRPEPGPGGAAGQPGTRRAARAAWLRGAGPLPASGVRVLDLTRVIAGPVCTRFLAALGADVLRLDPPRWPELPLHARDGLIGKRSALLAADTRHGGGRLHELLAGADVLVHGYRPGALDRFGLGAQELAERYPGLVVVSLTAWGNTGPWGDRRGFDSIVQAATGIASELRAGGGRPGALPCQLLDHGTGYLCAAAVLDALGRHAGDGGTYHRELSLARTAHWLLGQPRDSTTWPYAPSAGDDERWLVTLDSGDGPIGVVAPPGQLDGRPLTWPRALTAYGSDPPSW
jgi:CoA-transferase family III